MVARKLKRTNWKAEAERLQEECYSLMGRNMQLTETLEGADEYIRKLEQLLSEHNSMPWHKVIVEGFKRLYEDAKNFYRSFFNAR